MNIPEITRNITASIARKTPELRGIGLICNKINTLTLRFGAPSMAIAAMRDGTSMLVDLTTNTEKWAFYFGTYDEELMSAIHKTIDKNSCFLDVGANIGFVSVAVAKIYQKHHSKGRVIAFEPFKGNYEQLTSNIARNNLQKFVTTANIGLSSEERQDFIILREDFSCGSKTGNASMPVNEEFDKGFQRVPIQLSTLDIVWEQPQFRDIKIGLVKVDIEGHEDFFLRGAINTLHSQRPSIIMEVNKAYYRARGSDLDALFLPLLPDNYAFFKSTKKSWERFHSFNECQELDNAFLIPEEKLGTPQLKQAISHQL